MAEPEKRTQAEITAMLRGKVKDLRAEVSRLTEENGKLRGAISWALGEGDSDFGDHMPEDGKPRFWWRKELSRRADLSPQETTDA